jgi:hypothetical protein
MMTRARAALPAFLLTACAVTAAQPAPSALSLIVRDELGKPAPCNVFLKDAQGQPVRVEGLPFWRDHVAFSGEGSLPLPAGAYTYEIERGPEQGRLSGRVSIPEGDRRRLELTLPRTADLSALGWRSGETHVHRPLEEVERLMGASDLHGAQVITWWNRRNPWSGQRPPAELVRRFGPDRWYGLMAGEDEREGGALLYFGLERPLPIQDADREYPSPLVFLRQARRSPGSWVDVEKPFWWDVPLWLAAGADTIGIAHNHMHRAGVLENEAWGRPRDRDAYPGPQGNGRWTQELYYRILESGIRLPPSAGSASGVLPNPVGYNRAYAYVGQDRSPEAWSRALRAGRSFVTNGPLLLVRANGKLPGEVFRADRTLRLELTARLWSNDPVTHLEVVQNGKVTRTVPARSGGQEVDLGSVAFAGSGWLLVRAVADVPSTFRFASTAPFYVEAADRQPRISRRAAQFFLDWLEERAGRVNVSDAALKADVLAHFEPARRFWRERVAAATVE